MRLECKRVSGVEGLGHRERVRMRRISPCLTFNGSPDTRWLAAATKRGLEMPRAILGLECGGQRTHGDPDQYEQRGEDQQTNEEGHAP